MLSADFCEVEEYREQVIGLSAKVTVDFSCSLGYDREEEYLTLEKYRDNGVERQRQVVKTRTVTDWSPYHTVETFDTVAYALNRSASVAKYDSDESEICGEAVNACIEQMTSTDGEYEVEISALARARSQSSVLIYPYTECVTAMKATIIMPRGLPSARRVILSATDLNLKSRLTMRRKTRPRS